MGKDDASGLSSTDSPQLEPTCGIVMPIAEMGDCSESHWVDVLGILTDAIEDAGFSANVVSNADEVTVIQRTIVHNLYEYPIVVCDVSQKNPNVMFELGLRLAFDKPTIIVKDDRTSFSFDTGVVEHLEYPRDLRFTKITEFKHKLSAKIRATHKKQIADPDFSTFLRHFGRFTVSNLETTEISGQDYVIKQLEAIRSEINEISPLALGRRPLNAPAGHEIDICCGPMELLAVEQLEGEMCLDPQISSIRIADVADHYHIYASSEFDSVHERRRLERKYQEVAKEVDKRFKGRKKTKAEKDLETVQRLFSDDEASEDRKRADGADIG